MKSLSGNDGRSDNVKSNRKKITRRISKWGKRFFIVALLLVAIHVAKIAYNHASLDADISHGDTSHFTRTLKSGGAVWEKCDFEKANCPYAWLPLYFFIIFLLFIALAIICDDFFVPSLEAISEKLDLSEDVAGATFMAAGSSAPELFTSVAGVAVGSDVGVGTIVGSAMFNILVIVAMSAVLAGQVLQLDWRPMFRDTLVYTLSIVMLITFSWDEEITWYEALLLLIVYILYIIVMKYNSYLMRLLSYLADLLCRKCKGTRVEPTDEDMTEPSVSTVEAQHNHESPHHSHHGMHDDHKHHSHHSVHDEHTHHSHHSLHDEHKHRFVHSHRGELAGSFANRRRSTSHGIPAMGSTASANMHRPHLISLPTTASSPQLSDIAKEQSHASAKSQPPPSISHQSMEEEEEEEFALVLIPCLPAIRAVPPDIELARAGGNLGWAKFVFKWIFFVLSFPFEIVFSWSIPNCSVNRKWYVVTVSFIMSIVWIAVISFAMVTVVARVGCILNIDEFTMGLVVVAIGTSVPDALSSILVARDGFGDMAISNAIGSNVFDINLGLGLPFLIKICIDKGQPFHILSDEQRIDYANGEYAIIPHAKFGFLLLGVLSIVIFLFAAFRFKMNRFMSLCFVLIYVMFLIYAFVQELVCDGGKKC